MKNKFVAGNYGYGHAKTELLNAVLEYFKDAREKREELVNNMDYVEEVLAKGAAKAREIAKAQITAAKKAVGLIGNAYNK